MSPDSIVPDAAVLADYNRFMMVRGNPLRYSDPTGHCATTRSGDLDWNNDGECWSNATWIKEHWNESDPWGNEYNYWDKLFGSVDIFWDHVANQSANDNDFMKAHRGFYEKAKSAHVEIVPFFE